MHFFSKAAMMLGIHLYRQLMGLLRPAWNAAGLFRLYRGKEDPARFQERRARPSQARPEGPLIWIHGASIGEGRSALALIDQLLKDRPKLHILLTSQTLSAARALPSVLPPRTIHQMAPYDVPLYIRRFLAHWRPQAFCVIEAEMWPSTWYELHKLGVPMFLFNFHISEKSFRLWSRLPSFFRACYSFFKKRWTGSSSSYQRFTQLTPDLPLILMPSLKYGAPPLQARLQSSFDLKGRPAWLASCIHEAEEDLMLETHQRLRKHFPTLLLVYAPRHLERAAFVEKKARLQGWSAQRRSEHLDLQEEKDLYIVDTLGELAIFYQSFSFTVLGGSFFTAGGHNIIEPSVLGCAVIHGPSMPNNQDVVEDFQRCQAALQVAPENLFPAVLDWLQNPHLPKEAVHRASSLLAKAREEVGHIIQEFSKEIEPLVSDAASRKE